ncbi:PAS-domain containing protein [Roseiarcaceae bacterium H3SJ34-1]|uniref:PAS domain-containing hybrid sensor histidine kinase/response regulator n=1 Tax=Terripilifer ovatus TaxID=3032367 RepID=UPI003AB955A1|nr:PAS-domain containing protein [Roseiarcaceae bacterium H3SJ34-1]
MNAGGAAILAGLVYLCGLFAVAHYGDTSGRHFIASRARPVIYALTLAVYCTSWTFFGSVGLASQSGLDFLPTYIGPVIVIGLLFPLVLRIVRLAKAQNITSVADFVASRYGKSEQVAALVAIICVIGAVPYIALQLKAISTSVSTVLDSLDAGKVIVAAAAGATLPLLVAVVLACFAMAFGTRNIDATEHQDGLVLAIAAESLVKLVAFLVVGAYVTWWMFDGLADLSQRAAEDFAIKADLGKQPDLATWLTTTVLSACAIMLLPRQFHVTVVENRDERDIKTAAWLFPLYLILINIFVIPLAIAGRIVFADGSIDRDMTVLALPLHADANVIAVFTMVGGLSAATAMVIVASIALSIMISNDLVMPLLLRGHRTRGRIEAGDPASFILVIRRAAIVGLISLAYLYYANAAQSALASIGWLSFAAISQIAPSFFLGLFWSRATARGAMAGLLTGIVIWAYTLLLPSLATEPSWLSSIVANGPMGVAPLKPTALFGVELPLLVHGVAWSLAANVIAFVFFSLTRHTTAIERLQANIFIGTTPSPMSQTLRLWGADVTVSELESAVARYLGAQHTRRSFEDFMRSRGLPLVAAQDADIHLLRYAEHLLASAIGASSSRLVLSLLLRRRNLSREAALKLIDEASATLQYNRDLLQHALDFARQGITVFDRDLRLICWNREFRDLFDFPTERLRIGMGLEEVARFNAERGVYGPGSVDGHVASRIELLVNEPDPVRLRLHHSGDTIEIRSARMPDGGVVTTYTDVTQAVAAEEALERTNETLEQRVRLRTEELVSLNAELGRAKQLADEANLSKTRFLAAASHDILQPLNAARLYATSLLERVREQQAALGPDGGSVSLASNLDMSLEAVEEILTALLDISRLDAGAMKPELSTFPIEELMTHLRVEFAPLAAEKKLDLVFVPCSLSIRSDRRLLRRLLQNLISNAIKYTPKGRVLVGCRRKPGLVVFEVWDTGMGIPESKQADVFREFERLAPAAKSARGIGLGLSIVERLSRVLDHPISLSSTLGVGSVFRVPVPTAAAVAKRRAPAAVEIASDRHLPLHGMRVLAIDNEPRILDGLQALLTGWGCSVSLASNLHEANEAVDLTGPPDAVLADYHLDDGDGLACIAALRQRFGEDLPALLITADRSLEVRDRAVMQNVRLLNKPVRPAALRALLSQWRVLQRAAE